MGLCGGAEKGLIDFMFDTAVFAAKDNGANVYFAVLRTMNISLTGTGIADDFTTLLPKIGKCDAIIFATPSHYDNADPHIINLIDRLEKYPDALRGKKAAIIISGKEEPDMCGNEAAEYLKRFCRKHGMDVVDVILARANSSGEVTQNKELMAHLKELWKKF